MTNKSFQALFDQAQVDGDQFTTEISDNWMQGRAVYGGLTAALAVFGMRTSPDIESDRPLRSLMVNFIAPPKDNRLTVESQTLRTGGSVTCREAKIYSDGQILLNSTAIFGKGRDTVIIDPTVSMPADHTIPKTPDDFSGNPFVPVFVKQFQSSHHPSFEAFWGSNTKRMGMWIKHKDPIHPSNNLEKVVGLMDRPIGLIMAHMRQPGVISSATWNVDMLEPIEQETGDWFYTDIRLHSAKDGYSQQTVHLYNEEKRLIAVGSQNMIYFEPKTS